MNEIITLSINTACISISIKFIIVNNIKMEIVSKKLRNIVLNESTSALMGFIEHLQLRYRLAAQYRNTRVIRHNVIYENILFLNIKFQVEFGRLIK